MPIIIQTLLKDHLFRQPAWHPSLQSHNSYTFLPSTCTVHKNLLYVCVIMKLISVSLTGLWAPGGEGQGCLGPLCPQHGAVPARHRGGLEEVALRRCLLKEWMRNLAPAEAVVCLIQEALHLSPISAADLMASCLIPCFKPSGWNRDSTCPVPNGWVKLWIRSLSCLNPLVASCQSFHGLWTWPLSTSQPSPPHTQLAHCLLAVESICLYFKHTRLV